MIGSHDALPEEENDGKALFLEQLATIDAAIAFVCRRAGLRHADAEDFASYTKVRLIDNDYAVLRKYERRCVFAGFIAVVVQRMLLDYRIRLWGKFHASSEAKRLGDDAVALESLLCRDGLTIDEALSTLHRSNVAMTRAEAERIVEQLPRRAPRPKAVALDAATEEELRAPADEAAGASPFVRDRTALSRRLGSLIRQAIEDLPDSEQLLFRLRFEAGMTVAGIARVLKTDQKPLYRRIDTLIGGFRRHLEAAGIHAGDVSAIIGDPVSDLDFGFRSENDESRPSLQSGAERKNEEAR